MLPYLFSRVDVWLAFQPVPVDDISRSHFQRVHFGDERNFFRHPCSDVANAEWIVTEAVQTGPNDTAWGGKEGERGQDVEQNTVRSLSAIIVAMQLRSQVSRAH